MNKKSLTDRERRAVATVVAEKIQETDISYVAQVMYKCCGCQTCRRLVRASAQGRNVKMKDAFLFLRGRGILAGASEYRKRPKK